MCENEGLSRVRSLLRHQLATMYIKRVIKNLSHLVCTSMMMMMLTSERESFANYTSSHFFLSLHPFYRSNGRERACLCGEDERKKNIRQLYDDENFIFHDSLTLWCPLRFRECVKCGKMYTLTSAMWAAHACDKKKHFKRHFSHLIKIFSAWHRGGIGGRRQSSLTSSDKERDWKLFEWSEAQIVSSGEIEFFSTSMYVCVCCGLKAI